MARIRINLTQIQFTNSHIHHKRKLTEAAKILLLGLNRSGTTALAYRVFEAVAGRKILAFEPKTLSGAEDRSFHQGLIKKPQAIVTKCLIYPTNKTDWESIYANADLYAHSLWVARDPRDVIISSFFYHWYNKHGAADDLYQTALSRVRQKEQHPTETSFLDVVAGTLTKDRDQLADWQGSWYDHLNYQFDSIEQHLDVVHYEDIVAQNTARLDAATGLNTGNDFSVPQSRQRVARTRSSGNWRYWFTEEDVEFFRPLFTSYLARAGYEADDWKLEPVDRIASSEASDYMSKIRASNRLKRAVTLARQSAGNWYHAHKRA